MKNIITLLIVVMLFPTVSFSDQLLQYEPTLVEVKGTIASGKFQHPNGTWVKFYYIKLLEPASIKEDKTNSFNSSESGIKEMQLVSSDKVILSKLKKMSVKRHW